MPIPILKEYEVRLAGRKDILHLYCERDLTKMAQELRHAIQIKATGRGGLGADHNPTHDGIPKKTKAR